MYIHLTDSIKISLEEYIVTKNLSYKYIGEITSHHLITFSWNTSRSLSTTVIFFFLNIIFTQSWSRFQIVHKTFSFKKSNELKSHINFYLVMPRPQCIGGGILFSSSPTNFHIWFACHISFERSLRFHFGIDFVCHSVDCLSVCLSVPQSSNE